MSEAAKARGNALERLTSGRSPARESPASEATRHHTGSVPAGGLARQAVAASAAAGLPPPKTDGPSDATCRGQDSPSPSEGAGAILGGPAVGGASEQPRSPRHTDRGPGRRAIPHASGTVATGPRPASRGAGPTPAPPRDPQAWKGCKAPTRDAHAPGKGTAHPRAPSPGTRLGRQAVAASLWLAPGTLLPRGHWSALQRSPVSAALRAHARDRDRLRPPRSSGSGGQNADGTWQASATQRLAQSGHPGR